MIMNSPRTYLKINGVAKTFFLERSAVVENEPYPRYGEFERQAVAEKKCLQ